MPVRPARPADEHAIRRLQRHLAEPTPALVPYALSAGDALVSPAPANGALAGYLLAVVGDGPVTDASGATGAANANADASVRTGGAHVAELAVAPAHRREGRASALLDRLLADLAPGERVTLAVAPDNRAARALYDRAGFERVARDPDYFEDGPALVLARDAPGGRGDDADADADAA